MAYLYHVTLYRNLPRIADEGLRPGLLPRLSRDIKNWWIHPSFLYFTVEDGIRFWFSYVASDDPTLGVGHAPAVLRTNGRNVRGKVIDSAGTRDAEGATAYKTKARSS